MFIGDGGGGFWQWDQYVYPVPPVDETSTVTISVPLSSFTDRSGEMLPPLSMDVLDPENGVFSMGLATNTNGTFTFQIDNIRVRTAVPGGLAVPEPASCALWLFGMVATLTGGCRRRR
jgi:hypothetical protein